MKSRKKRESGIAIRESKVREASEDIQEVRHRDNPQANNKDKEFDLSQNERQSRRSGQYRSSVLQLVQKTGLCRRNGEGPEGEDV